MHLSKEEQILLEHYKDLIQLSYQRGIPVFSQFASLREQELACQALDNFYGNNWQEGKQAVFNGGYPGAERRMICFLAEQSGIFPETLEFPLCCIRLTPANKRFCDSLNHRDYLGTVMNLGITRDQIGDILVKQEKKGGTAFSTAYLFCKKDKVELLSEITRIKHTTVTAEAVSFEEMDWKPDFKEITGSVSSFRLDGILSLVTKTSRSKSLELIQSGEVFLNGRCCTENAKKLEPGDTFSARGYGKFLFEQSNSQSKKGRYHITVKQYI